MDFIGVNSGCSQELTKELFQTRASVSSQTLRCVPPAEEITDVQSSCRLGGAQTGLIQRCVVGGKVSVPGGTA